LGHSLAPDLWLKRRWDNFGPARMPSFRNVRKPAKPSMRSTAGANVASVSWQFRTESLNDGVRSQKKHSNWRIFYGDPLTSLYFDDFPNFENMAKYQTTSDPICFGLLETLASRCSSFGVWTLLCLCSRNWCSGEYLRLLGSNGSCGSLHQTFPL
jgi:hypothetical protein